MYRGILAVALSLPSDTKEKVCQGDHSLTRMGIGRGCILAFLGEATYLAKPAAPPAAHLLKTLHPLVNILEPITSRVNQYLTLL